MIRHGRLFLLLILWASCKSYTTTADPQDVRKKGDFTIAFGSCNRTDLENPFWDDILGLKPDLWIWGGDKIDADTEDMTEMRAMYVAQNQVRGYRELREAVPVIGTWDDHDYGLNDGGSEYPARAESQQEFLDFMGVPADSPRRRREGIYASHTYTTPGGTLKVIVLDTRYFRTPLKKDQTGGRGYLPDESGEGTILGPAQWAWLEEELHASDADFNILVSSIQVLSGEHGFETWGNFPHEVRRLIHTVGASGARGVFVLSGDRHISEFSRLESPSLSYPLLDFTSSGLTHAYRGFTGEPNPYRVGGVVPMESFGLVILDFDKGEATFQMRGEGDVIQRELRQSY